MGRNKELFGEEKVFVIEIRKYRRRKDMEKKELGNTLSQMW